MGEEIEDLLVFKMRNYKVSDLDLFFMQLSSEFVVVGCCWC
jgi:hypothetical protein